MTPAETLERERKRAAREALELQLLQQIRAAKLDAGMVRQYRPFTDRRFAWDFAWPENDPKVMLEVQGGIWTGGAHARGVGITRDIEKANKATLAGWYLLFVTAEHIRDGRALQWIAQMVRP
jgi:hypothetical protein